MSGLLPEAQPSGLDRARELASIGAGHAAGALARLINRTIWMEVPRAQPVDAGTVPRAAALAEDGSAIFFELQGGVGGMMAVVFSRASLEVIVTEMMGADAYELESAVESASRTTRRPSPTPWARWCCPRSRCSPRKPCPPRWAPWSRGEPASPSACCWSPRSTTAPAKSRATWSSSSSSTSTWPHPGACPSDLAARKPKPPGRAARRSPPTVLRA